MSGHPEEVRDVRDEIASVGSAGLRRVGLRGSAEDQLSKTGLFRQ